jgi:hypothetical protein
MGGRGNPVRKEKENIEAGRSIPRREKGLEVMEVTAIGAIEVFLRIGRRIRNAGGDIDQGRGRQGKSEARSQNIGTGHPSEDARDRGKVEGGRSHIVLTDVEDQCLMRAQIRGKLWQ